MSKMKNAIVRLSAPVPMSRFDAATKMYVTGLASTNPIIDNLRIVVSSYVTWSLDDDLCHVWTVRTVFTYNIMAADDGEKWHEFDADEPMHNLREAVKLADSRAREAYATALERAIAGEMAGKI